MNKKLLIIAIVLFAGQQLCARRPVTLINRDLIEAAATNKDVLPFIQEGATGREIDNTGRYALHWAARTLNLSNARHIGKMDPAEVNYQDNLTMTPLMIVLDKMTERKDDALALLKQLDDGLAIVEYLLTLPIKLDIKYTKGGQNLTALDLAEKYQKEYSATSVQARAFRKIAALLKAKGQASA